MVRLERRASPATCRWRVVGHLHSLLRTKRFCRTGALNWAVEINGIRIVTVTTARHSSVCSLVATSVYRKQSRLTVFVLRSARVLSCHTRMSDNISDEETRRKICDRVCNINSILLKISCGNVFSIRKPDGKVSVDHLV